jgi:secreted trypsin-like serine protease
MTNFLKTSFLIFAVGGLVACGEAPFSKSNQGPLESAIVGGTPVPKDARESKSVVMIYDLFEETTCTGTLIGEDLILTAGHCVFSEAAEIKVSFGVTQIGDNTPPMQDVIAYRRHPDYKKSENERNDVAVIRFKGPRPSDSEFAVLPPNTQTLTIGQPFTAVGFGWSTGKIHRFDIPDGGGILRQVSRQIDEVTDRGFAFVTNQLDGKGVCFGDSGGPALVYEQDRAVIFGIASGIFPSSSTVDIHDLEFDACSQKSIYMKVQPYNSWIRKAVAELLKEPVDQAGQIQGIIK